MSISNPNISLNTLTLTPATAEIEVKYGERTKGGKTEGFIFIGGKAHNVTNLNGEKLTGEQLRALPEDQRKKIENFWKTLVNDNEIKESFTGNYKSVSVNLKHNQGKVFTHFKDGKISKSKLSGDTTTKLKSLMSGVNSVAGPRLNSMGKLAAPSSTGKPQQLQKPSPLAPSRVSTKPPSGRAAGHASNASRVLQKQISSSLRPAQMNMNPQNYTDDEADDAPRLNRGSAANITKTNSARDSTVGKTTSKADIKTNYTNKTRREVLAEVQNDSNTKLKVAKGVFALGALASIGVLCKFLLGAAILASMATPVGWALAACCVVGIGIAFAGTRN